MNAEEEQGLSRHEAERTLTLLTRQQEALHKNALEVIRHQHRNRFWKQMSIPLEKFELTKVQFGADAEYAIIVFDNAINPRPVILHDFAVSGLQGIPWTYQTVPEQAYGPWQLLHGIATWRGNFNTTTIFDLGNAEIAVREVHRKHLP